MSTSRSSERRSQSVLFGTVTPARQRVTSRSGTPSDLATRLEVTFARLMVMSRRAEKARLELLFLRVLSSCASKFIRRFMACNAPRDSIPTKPMCFALRIRMTPKPMLAVECWRPDRRVVRVSFSASKRPLLHVVSAPRKSQRSFDGNRHGCCLRYRAHGEVAPPLSSSEVGTQQERSPDEESLGTLARWLPPVRRHPLLSPAGPGSSTGRIRAWL